MAGPVFKRGLSLQLFFIFGVTQIDPLSPWPLRGGNVLRNGRSSAGGGPSQNATVLFNFSTQSWVESSPAVGRDGSVFIGGNDGSVYALSSVGALLWNFTALTSKSAPHHFTIVHLPCLRVGYLYIGNDNRYMYALNSTTGVQLWRFLTGNRLRSTPVISLDGGTLYFGSFDGYLYDLVRGHRHASRWRRFP